MCDRICKKVHCSHNCKYLEIRILIIQWIITWSCVYAILHDSTAIQGASVDTVFNGLLAEFPAILDSFFHQYHKCICPGAAGGGLGWRQVHKNFTVMVLGQSKALLCWKFHKKLPNQWLTSLSRRVAILSHFSHCSGQPQHFDAQPCTRGRLKAYKSSPSKSRLKNCWL